MAVVDRYEPHAFWGKHDVGIEADFQVVPAQSAHILYNHYADVSHFDLRYHFWKSLRSKVVPNMPSSM